MVYKVSVVVIILANSWFSLESAQKGGGGGYVEFNIPRQSPLVSGQTTHGIDQATRESWERSTQHLRDGTQALQRTEHTIIVRSPYNIQASSSSSSSSSVASSSQDLLPIPIHVGIDVATHDHLASLSEKTCDNAGRIALGSTLGCSSGVAYALNPSMWSILGVAAGLSIIVTPTKDVRNSLRYAAMRSRELGGATWEHVSTTCGTVYEKCPSASQTFSSCKKFCAQAFCCRRHKRDK